MDPTAAAVERRFWGLWWWLLGDGGDGGPPKSIDLRPMSILELDSWSVVVPAGGYSGGKLWWNWFLVELCHLFQANVAACNSGDWSGIVYENKDDLLETIDWLTVALIGRTEVEKMVEHYYCTAPTMVFWTVFQQQWALPAANIDLGLLTALRGVWWKCQSG